MTRFEGFTLVEMLIAVIIVGTSLAVFFQLIASSLKLEKKSRDQFDSLIAAKETFNRLNKKDLRSDDFPWKGGDENTAWVVQMFAPGCAAISGDGEEQISTSIGNYYKIQIEAEYKDHGRVVLERYIRFPDAYFSDEFKAGHIQANSDCPQQ